MQTKYGKVRHIKFTNKDQVFEKMDLLKEMLKKKFNSNIKTYTSLIEYLVDDKIEKIKDL